MTQAQFIIYGLVDPRTDEVRYIGKSASGMDRPKFHAYPCALRGRSRKNAWIKNLQATGRSYEIRVLAETSNKQALMDLEIQWIKQGFAQGWPLTNLVAGGEGRGHPPAHYERLSRQFRGVPRTGVALMRIREGAAKKRGVARSNETKQALSRAAKRQFAVHVNRVRDSRAKGGRPFVDQHGRRYEILGDAVTLLNVSASNVCAVLNGRRTHTCGFVFRYIDA